MISHVAGLLQHFTRPNVFVYICMRQGGNGIVVVWLDINIEHQDWYNIITMCNSHTSRGSIHFTPNSGVLGFILQIASGGVWLREIPATGVPHGIAFIWACIRGLVVSYHRQASKYLSNIWNSCDIEITIMQYFIQYHIGTYHTDLMLSVLQTIISHGVASEQGLYKESFSSY